MKRDFFTVLAAAALASASSSTSDCLTLDDFCDADYITSVLPTDVASSLIVYPDTLVLNAVTGYDALGSDYFPNTTDLSFCNITFNYGHAGLDDEVTLRFWAPPPSTFQGRYLSTGGSGPSIDSGSLWLPSGIIEGAVAGETDGGFPFGFELNSNGQPINSFDDVMLVTNGTVNWQNVYLFGYQAQHELAILGKAFTKNLYNMTNDNEKLYSYYQGCSEGGREGWSQVQRYGDQFDGAVIGAPAIRYSFQQVQHYFSAIVEQTLNYAPPPCEIDQIITSTISECDGLDGKLDGVVSRTDLCKLYFDPYTLVGTPYNCAAATGTPAQNGTIVKEAIDVYVTIIDGLRDSKGRQAYLSYQPSAGLMDATTTWDATTGTWVPNTGGDYVPRFIQLINETALSTLENITYDTLKEWMIQAWQMYDDSLQVNWPDLSPVEASGGKILHYHGESDFSIPTASSVRYWDSVRKIMYPDMSYNASAAALNEWYRLYLVPGAGHCQTNSAEPNGPFPNTNLAVMIDWVEKGIEPNTLNATHLLGDQLGENAQICPWPLRPFWTNQTAPMQCVYNQTSIDSWHYNLNAFKLPVY